jgi:hypothetical protein
MQRVEGRRSSGGLAVPGCSSSPRRASCVTASWIGPRPSRSTRDAGSTTRSIPCWRSRSAFCHTTSSCGEAGVQPVSAEAGARSIAVLPFVNMSEDPGNENPGGLRSVPARTLPCARNECGIVPPGDRLLQGRHRSRSQLRPRLKRPCRRLRGHYGVRRHAAQRGLPRQSKPRRRRWNLILALRKHGHRWATS